MAARKVVTTWEPDCIGDSNFEISVSKDDPVGALVANRPPCSIWLQIDNSCVGLASTDQVDALIEDLKEARSELLKELNRDRR
jgi:hypothetical protein